MTDDKEKIAFDALSKMSAKKLKETLLSFENKERNDLHTAIELDLLPAIVSLCKDKDISFTRVDFLKLDSNQLSAVNSAAKKGQISELQALIPDDKNKLSYNDLVIGSNSGVSPLESAISGKKLKEMSLALEEMGTPLKKHFLFFGKNRNMLLHSCIEEGILDQASEIVIQAGDKITRQDIMTANEKGQNGINYAVRGDTLIELNDYLIAIDNKGISKEDLLQKKGSNNTPLYSTLVNNSFKNASKIFLQNGDHLFKNEIMEEDDWERNFLHHSAGAGFITSVVALLPKKESITHADVLKADRWKETVLHYAAKGGTLIDLSMAMGKDEKIKKNDFMLKDIKGENVTHKASANGSVMQIVEILEKNKEKLTINDILITNNDNSNSIHIAAENGNLEKLGAAMRKSGEPLRKMDLFIKDNRNETAIHIAIEKGHLEQVIKVCAMNGETLTIKDVIKGSENFSRAKLGNIIYDKDGKKIEQFFKAKMFDLKSLNTFWKEMPEEYKSKKSFLVYRKCQQRLREEATKKLDPAILQAKDNIR